ncbi:MAG: GTP 3',8-cyclase MoaA [Treponema sp.]
MKDRYGRSIDYLRVSITDRCNYRCTYCMPRGAVQFLPAGDILSADEIIRIVQAAAELGIRHIKITGGEPLVRNDAVQIIAGIRRSARIEDITLTTNGYYLADYAGDLAQAGIRSVNVSLDTLDSSRYAALCGVDGLARTVAGIAAAQAQRMQVKLNVTVSNDTVSEDIYAVVEYGMEHRLTVRFIELMPIGCGYIAGMGTDSVRRLLEDRYGAVQPCLVTGNGPARYYRFANNEKSGGTAFSIGFISAIQHCFCAGCNRIRLTADGYLHPCLADSASVDVRTLLRSGCTDTELQQIIINAITAKPECHRFMQKPLISAAMHRIGG